MTTTAHSIQPTVSLDGQQHTEPPEELLRSYCELLSSQQFSWTAHPRFKRLLGKGGQGVVYLSERRGADGFTVPIALKVFSPERYEDTRSYDQAMVRIGHVAARVAQIQQDNLLDVQDFYDRNHIRLMAMEWINGYDLRTLLSNELLERIRHRVSANRWRHINEVILTEGEVQPRVMPGIAVAITRECLAALAALHREGIVHGDIKPGNIMLKLTGNAKIIDIGSAFEIADPPPSRSCTPSYAAPEILDGAPSSPQSDLASLGYVLIELMAGRPLFVGLNDYQQLLEAKREIHIRLTDYLPAEVSCNQLLMGFCRRLIASDPTARFGSAEAANLVKEGAAAFHRQLIMSDLASEYENDIRVWLEEVQELDQLQDSSGADA